MTTDIHTLAGAYALDAVDDIERASFDRHLAECPSCAEELAELRATVARMTVLTTIAPPAHLKAAVLAEAGRTRQVPPGRRTPDAARRRGWRTWAVGVAAAAVIGVAGGGVGYVISDQNTRSEHTAVVSEQSINARVAAIMSAPDASVHVQTLDNGGRVSVTVAPSLNQGVAVMTKLPDVRADQSYQLWLIHGKDAPVSAGLVGSGRPGGTVFLTGVQGANGFGVSLEKASGAATPTAPLVTSFAI